jgi:hypothetical protein
MTLPHLRSKDRPSPLLPLPSIRPLPQSLLPSPTPVSQGSCRIREERIGQRRVVCDGVHPPSRTLLYWSLRQSPITHQSPNPCSMPPTPTCIGLLRDRDPCLHPPRPPSSMPPPPVLVLSHCARRGQSSRRVDGRVRPHEERGGRDRVGSASVRHRSYRVGAAVAPLVHHMQLV